MSGWDLEQAIVTVIGRGPVWVCVTIYNPGMTICHVKLQTICVIIIKQTKKHTQTNIDL